jgi:nucleoside-diphosphate-sugar epimerase
MKVFLAGGTGVIGRSLVPLLASAGHDVVGMVRSAKSSARLKSLGGRGVIVDAFDRAGLLRVLSAEKPDAAIDQLTDLAGFDLEANARLRKDAVADRCCVHSTIPPGAGCI